MAGPPDTNEFRIETARLLMRALQPGDAAALAAIWAVYVITPSAWGKGYATEAALALSEHGFRRLGLARVIALIDPTNAASARVVEKVGLRFERETRRPGGKIMQVYASEVAS